MTDKITREEAIETVRRCCPRISDSECDFETAMRVLIPELTESKDERIRQSLLAYIKGESKRLDTKKWIAYLEKQKESHFTKRNALFDKCVANCDPEVMKKVFDEVDERLQKEQKPSINIDQLKSLMLQYLQEAANEKDDSDIEADTDKWTRKILGYDFEQKPAEWSEDDEHRRKDAIYFLESAKRHYADTSEIEKTIAWLNSLRPQPKIEWSEEDEKNLELVIDCVYEFYPDPVMKYKLKDWLTQRLKSLRPQPHWKPSEEQMKALEIILRYGDKESTHIKNLTSLYEQLKKL